MQTVDVIVPILSLLVGGVAGYITHRGVTSQERSRRQQYFSELRQWADETVNILSEAVHICDLDPSSCKDPSFYNRQHQLKISISSLIDRGRWFFPNSKDDGYGDWKPEAFKGHRLESLEALVKSYRIIRNIDSSNAGKNLQFKLELTAEKKTFVSEIQKRLNSRIVQEEFDKAMKYE